MFLVAWIILLGWLVGRVGDTLSDRRDNVVRLASNLDTGVSHLTSLHYSCCSAHRVFS